MQNPQVLGTSVVKENLLEDLATCWVYVSLFYCPHQCYITAHDANSRVLVTLYCQYNLVPRFFTIALCDGSCWEYICILVNFMYLVV